MVDYLVHLIRDDGKMERDILIIGPQDRQHACRQAEKRANEEDRHGRKWKVVSWDSGEKGLKVK